MPSAGGAGAKPRERTLPQNPNAPCARWRGQWGVLTFPRSAKHFAYSDRILYNWRCRAQHRRKHALASANTNGDFVTEENVFRLARFYFGNLVLDNNRTSTTAGIVARTPHITPEQAAECVRIARLAPPLLTERSDAMRGALGLFVGSSNTAEFLLVKAQHNEAGYPQVLYIFVPLAALRQLQGNVLAFRALGLMEMPAFSEVKTTLPPFELRNPTPPDAETQARTLADLLLYCQDSFATVEGLLAGVVQGWPVAIVNSPPDLEKRLRFLQGLLSLLPPPARVGITFATHVNNFTSAKVQIKFASQSAKPENHVVYDWGNGNLLTEPLEDPYSHYIVAQLRLDPTLVVERTTQLARTAVWRAMQREKLAQALAWVSRRAALDQTVLNGQPADREKVAAVLREDPTLPDDLRLAYVRHLLAFALALNEPESADVVAAQCATRAPVAQAVTEQLRTALENGQAQVVYALLERWILRVPEGAAVAWQPLLHQAAQTHFHALLAADRIPEALAFLEALHAAPPALQLEKVFVALVQSARKAARSHSALARALFLLAAEFASVGDLHQLLTDAAFVRQLPPETQTAIAYLQPEPRGLPPAHVLDAGARVFGEGYRMVVLARFVELAVILQRTELVDTTALQALLVMTQSPRSDHFAQLIHHIVEDFSQTAVLQTLDPPGPRVLVQLLLQMREHEQALAMLELYQSELFGAARLEEFTKLAGEIFRLVALPPEELNAALQQLEGSQLRPAPRAAIYCNALINRRWAADQEYAAKRLTAMLFHDSTLVDAIGVNNALRLLAFLARAQNALDTFRVATALTEYAVQKGKDGAELLTRMWPHITEGGKASQMAVELLRRFVRGVPMRHAPPLIAYFERELGPETADMLRATYMMRFIVPEADFQQFIEHLHLAASLLVDVACVYHAEAPRPTVGQLRRDLDTMPGGLNDAERQQIAANMVELQRLIFELGKGRARRAAKDTLEALLQAQAAPKSGVELLYFIGGHFGKHEPRPLTLHSEEMAHLFGSRSAAMLLRESTVVTRLLRGLQTAFQELQGPPPSARALRAELNSLWDTLSLYNKRRYQSELAQDSQHLAAVLGVMAKDVNERTLGNGGPARQLENGKRQPQNALEALRWVHGYFARKHSRV